MLKFSTDLVNFLQAGGSFKEAFEDAILTIYSGSQPANADATATGTKLVEITLEGNSFQYGTQYSLPQIDQVTVSSAAAGTNTVTIDGIDISDTTDGTETVDDIAKRLVRKIEMNKNTAQKVIPIYIGSGKFVMRSKLAGQSFTLSVNGNLTTTSIQSHSRANGLHFSTVSDGKLDKESGTWQGDGITDGTAGWFRLQGKISTFALDGNVGTYGADLNLASTSITQGNPVTIDSFSITQPKTSS